jgi:hypothetical protein
MAVVWVEIPDGTQVTGVDVEPLETLDLGHARVVPVRPDVQFPTGPTDAILAPCSSVEDHFIHSQLGTVWRRGDDVRPPPHGH